MRDPDLRDATITVTVGRCQPRPAQRHRLRDAAGRPGRADRLLAAMRRAAPWFRARVSEKAGLRYAPEIRFELDRTFDEADRSAPCCAGPTWRATSKDD